MRWKFEKWEGAGNDFVLLDARHQSFAARPDSIRRLTDRHFGIGCDQLLVVGAARTPGAALAFDIWNIDGSQARQCGNGARCVAAWAIRQGLLEPDGGVFDSPSGALHVRGCDGSIEIDMGAPRFEAADVPYLGPAEADAVFEGHLYAFHPVSMGNPHAVVFVDDVASAPVHGLGAMLQRDPRFPEQCNVEFVQTLGERRFAVRVFERGAGETLACGSGACAVAAVIWRSRRAGGDALELELPGGTLRVRREDDARPGLWLSGPANHVFDGDIEL